MLFWKSSRVVRCYPVLRSEFSHQETLAQFSNVFLKYGFITGVFLHNMLLLAYIKLSNNILPITRHLASHFNHLLYQKSQEMPAWSKQGIWYHMQQGHGKYVLESISEQILNVYKTN